MILDMLGFALGMGLGWFVMGPVVSHWLDTRR